MKGKILYDIVHSFGGSYRESLKDRFTGKLPDELTDTSYSELHTHYLFIVNRDKRMFGRIKQRVIKQLERVAEQTTLVKGDHYEFWRISCPSNVTLIRRKVFRGDWEQDVTLNEKGEEAIKTLVERAESNQI